MEGFVSKYLNATYLNLIPKCEKPKSFADFRPISLCNLVYKVITKIIFYRLKPLLVGIISEELFGFLKNRHILEVVGIT